MASTSELRNSSVKRDFNFNNTQTSNMVTIPRVILDNYSVKPAGSIVYDITTQQIWYSDGLEWIPLMAGGNAVLQSGTEPVVQNFDVETQSNVITFPKAFLNTPNVIANLRGTSTFFTERLLESYITNITTTNFTLDTKLKYTQITNILPVTGDVVSASNPSISMAVLTTGFPAAAFSFDSSANPVRLYFAVCSTIDGSGFWTVSTIESGVGLILNSVSLAILQDGTPAVAYQRGVQVYFAKCASIDGSGPWTTMLAANIDPVVSSLTLKVLSTGNPAIVYQGPANSIDFVSNAQADGLGVWTNQVVLAAQSSTMNTCFTILPNGLPAFVYLSSAAPFSLRLAVNAQADGAGAWSNSAITTTSPFPTMFTIDVLSTGYVVVFGHATFDLVMYTNSDPNGGGTWTVTNIGDLEPGSEFRHPISTILGDGTPAVVSTFSDAVHYSRGPNADGSGTWITQDPLGETDDTQTGVPFIITTSEGKPLVVYMSDFFEIDGNDFSGPRAIITQIPYKYSDDAPFNIEWIATK